jgi:Lrp/AsnC family transcriptional regulator for asnA, asnC and gidA
MPPRVPERSPPIPAHKLLDKVDFDIIATLRRNARQSNTEIARQLGISEASVRRRIGRLVAEDVVQLTAIPNPQKMGYNAVAFIAMDVPLNQLDAVTEQLAARPEVQFVSTTTGRYDIFIWAMFKSAGDLHNFLRNDLAKIEGIAQTETFINLEIKKRFLG